MEFYFKYSLTESDRDEIIKYIFSLNFFVFEQHPDWPGIVGDESNYCFFVAKENNNVKCFAQISEVINPLVKIANLHFGPICDDTQIMIESIQKIYDYYRIKHFSQLMVQLAIRTGDNTELIEYKLNSLLNIRYIFDRNNWSSICLDLSKQIDVIFRNFSKGHKSDIKRAEKNGLNVKKMPLSEKEIMDFAALYVKMNHYRNIPVNNFQISQRINDITKFIGQKKIGNIYLVKETSGQVVGGAIVLFQGKSVRYYKGASDPDRRDLPISHIAIWEAIKDAQINGFDFFDFWGFNHMVGPTDQVYQINKFKKGFGGEFTFYPKIMYFNYRPALIMFYNIILKFKKMLINHA